MFNVYVCGMRKFEKNRMSPFEFEPYVPRLMPPAFFGQLYSTICNCTVDMPIIKSSLLKAVREHNIEDLHSVLDSGKEDIDVVDGDLKLTPLQLAVTTRFYEGVILLLERGAQINVCDVRQETPLHLSCRVYSTYMMSALIEKGAEINCMDMDWRSPLHLAVMINFKGGVELLLSRGADLNTQDDSGDTPLHSAVKDVKLQIVEMLLNNGAKLNLKNEDGETALHIAAALHERSVVRLLLLYGAEVDVQDYKGRTPLHLVLKYRDCNKNNIMEDLLDWGASLIIRDNDGDTPLSLAAKKSVPVDGWIKHLIKLQCIGLQLAYKTGYMYPTDTLEEYKTLCANELAKLKTTRFGNKSVLDVFSKYKDPTFISNSKMREAIYSSDFETEFPLYTVIMRVMFRHAEKRVPLLNAAQGVLIHLIGAHLPLEISRKIISNLSNEDIVNLITVGNCI